MHIKKKLLENIIVYNIYWEPYISMQIICIILEYLILFNRMQIICII